MISFCFKADDESLFRDERVSSQRGQRRKVRTCCSSCWLAFESFLREMRVHLRASARSRRTGVASTDGPAARIEIPIQYAKRCGFNSLGFGSISQISKRTNKQTRRDAHRVTAFRLYLVAKCPPILFLFRRNPWLGHKSLFGCVANPDSFGSYAFVVFCDYICIGNGKRRFWFAISNQAATKLRWKPEHLHVSRSGQDKRV